ncbi:MAG TPA: hypothetical protein VLE53_08090 [Gemmatimonadaceae bacterium]|nr:hypothetical protein [Gemmatimonadaceae bacterium]
MRSISISALAMSGAAMLAWGAHPAAAQDTTSAAAQAVAQYVTERLTSELDLTADQVSKVQAISLQSATELEELIDRYDADTTAASDSALVEGTVDMLQEHQAELQKVLTPEQWAQHQRNRAKRLALALTEVMVYDLDLTSAQMPEVERINLASADKLVTALQAKGISRPTPEQFRETARPILMERDVALQRVLTVSQWDELERNRRALHDLSVQQAASDSVAPKKPKR